ncbi:polysaccharide biosynthesis C-terminal domain-containing protein [Bacteroidales bacterium OttesenSCG-928-L03]|nr:polysaccharide biosynthesis C-terminal domain-containing protein [Bacteroidales bacterium OttesenSCG-928-L03]
MGFYFIGTFATRLLQLIFIPIYSKFVTPSDLGDYSLILAIISIVIPLLFQSIWEGAFRFAIEHEGREHNILATTTKYCMSLSVIYSIIFFLVSYVFPIKYPVLILLMGLGQMGTSYWQFSARALKRNKLYSFSVVVNSAVTILLNIILIVVFRWGLLGLLISSFAGNLIMIIILENRMSLLKHSFRYKFNKSLFSQVMKYSIPLAINAISWWLFSSVNNLVITSELGSSANGVFALAVKVGTIFATITTVISMAWQEEAFRTHGKQNASTYFNATLDHLIKILFSVVLLLIPFTFIIYKYFVFGDYKEGVLLAPFLFIGASYQAFANHLGSAFLARKESKILFVTTFVGGLITFFFSVVLIKQIGLEGAVYSSLIGFMITYLVRIPLLKKRMEVKPKVFRLFSLTIFSVLLIYLCNYKPESLIYQLTILFVIIILVFLVNRKLIIMIYSKTRNKFCKRPIQ